MNTAAGVDTDAGCRIPGCCRSENGTSKAVGRMAHGAWLSPSRRRPIARSIFEFCQSLSQSWNVLEILGTDMTGRRSCSLAVVFVGFLLANWYLFHYSYGLYSTPPSNGAAGLLGLEESDSAAYLTRAWMLKAANGFLLGRSSYSQPKAGGMHAAHALTNAFDPNGQINVSIPLRLYLNTCAWDSINRHRFCRLGIFILLMCLAQTSSELEMLAMVMIF